MPELRKDYLLDQYVIISTERAKRPTDFKHAAQDEKPMTDPFSPGNEGMTPPETDRFERDGAWLVRAFPNKFPIVQPPDESSKISLRTDNTFFTFADAVGEHEVVVETPDIDRMLHDLASDEIKDVLFMYRRRILAIQDQPGVKYVCVFKNHKKAAGTSLYHTHTQIIGFNMIPPLAYAEEEACRRFRDCPYCQIMEIERSSDRNVLEDDFFIAFTPYASRFPMEVWIFPKRHVRNVCDLNDAEVRALSGILKHLTGKLAGIDAPYNMVLKNGIDRSHFHVQIAPRLTTWAGFEIGTGIIVNPVAPEDAARFYRD